MVAAMGLALFLSHLPSKPLTVLPANFPSAEMSRHNREATDRARGVFLTQRKECDKLLSIGGTYRLLNEDYGERLRQQEERLCDVAIFWDYCYWTHTAQTDQMRSYFLSMAYEWYPLPGVPFDPSVCWQEVEWNAEF